MSNEFNQVNKLKKIPRQNKNFNDVNFLPLRESVIRSSRVKDISNDGKFMERLIKISRVTKVTKGVRN